MRLNPDPMECNPNPSQLDDLVETYVEEYSNLNTTMDEIDSFMDSLEQKTDNLYSELKQLLEENRKARQEFSKEGSANAAQSADIETEKSQELIGALSLQVTDDTTECEKSNLDPSIDHSKCCGDNITTTDGENNEEETCSGGSPKEDSGHDI